MSDFDPIRALREELSGLDGVLKLVSTHARETERKLAEAEADHNAFVKMEGTMKGLVNNMRERLKAMEIEAERKATPT